MNHFPPPASLSIKNLILDQWTLPDRLTDEYTLLLIQSGEGHHLVNGNQFAYGPGDIFFLGIQDEYGLLITQPTNLYRLTFSPSFVSTLPSADSAGWAYLNWSASPWLESLTTDATSQDNVRALLSILLSEERSLRPLTNNAIVSGLMKTLLSLLDRLFSQRGVTIPTQPTHSLDVTRRVIAYISQHIHEPNQLRMDALADEFNYSPGHLSTLFRQQAGDSIQQFIIRHKLKLVASRLRHTSLTVSQIADEFGFSDVCHLNKHFKRQYNHTPTVYRQCLSAL